MATSIGAAAKPLVPPILVPENRWWKLIHRVVKSCLERPWFDWYILIRGIAHTQHPLLTTLWLMNGDEWRWLKGTYHRKAPSIYSRKAMQWVDEWKLMNPLKVRSTNHRIGFSTSHPKIWIQNMNGMFWATIWSTILYLKVNSRKRTHGSCSLLRTCTQDKS